jgi:hypothetical protein
MTGKSIMSSIVIILGQVLTAGQGQNPARQAHGNAGLPQEARPGASTRSAARACAPWRSACSRSAGRRRHRRRRRSGNMSMAPMPRICAGVKMGRHEHIDTMIRDGAVGCLQRLPHGQTAENVAEQWQISRDEQDEFAVASRTRPKPRRRPASSPTRSSPSPSRPARATSWSRRTSTSPRRDHGGMPSCARPSTRTARSPRPTPRASTTARPRPC